MLNINNKKTILGIKLKTYMVRLYNWYFRRNRNLKISLAHSIKKLISSNRVLYSKNTKLAKLNQDDPIIDAYWNRVQ